MRCAVSPEHLLQLSLVVACFNEEQRLLPARFLAALEAWPQLQLLFVDDGSTDGTPRVLAELVALHPRARLLALPSNVGKAEAVRAGVLAVLDTAKPPAWVGYWDADLATPLDELAGFKGAIARHPAAGFFAGARVGLMGRRIERDPVRHVAGRVFATAASLALGLGTYDTQCGAKVLEADLARELFAEPLTTRWLLDVELLARLVAGRGGEAAARLVVEVPLEAWRDVGGSKLKPRDFVLAPLELAGIWRRYLRGQGGG
jgi:dolichyl-phosphate beta-glucosyltransferase